MTASYMFGSRGLAILQPELKKQTPRSSDTGWIGGSVNDGVTASWMISGFPFAALLSVTAVVVSITASAWLAVRRPALGLIFFFFLFAFAWRLLSVLYIDLFGPLFSDQLERDIGPGISALPIAISQGLVFMAVLFSFRRQRMRATRRRERVWIGRSPAARAIFALRSCVLGGRHFCCRSLAGAFGAGPNPTDRRYRTF